VPLPPLARGARAHAVRNSTNRQLGQGTQRYGGSPSTNDGHYIAFGITEEALIKGTLGLKARSGDGPLNRTTGVGRVAAHDGDYADALPKKHPVALLVAETTGALSKRFVRWLKALHTAARRPGGRDTTVYRQPRASTTSLFGHHVAAISTSPAPSSPPTRSHTRQQRRLAHVHERRAPLAQLARYAGYRRLRFNLSARGMHVTPPRRSAGFPM
jgi:hypothetical protein